MHPLLFLSSFSLILVKYLSLWDGLTTDDTAKVIVIGTTNQPRLLPDSILRRLPVQYEIDLPGKAEREAILRVVCPLFVLGDEM